MQTLTLDRDGDQHATEPKETHQKTMILMDERLKELVAMGASAAANCHPCLDHHLAKCDELGIDREAVAAAVKVGLMVNHGAENAIRKKARALLGESAMEK